MEQEIELGWQLPPLNKVNTPQTITDSHLPPPFLLHNFTDLQAGMIVHNPVLVKNSECESWSGHF